MAADVRRAWSMLSGDDDPPGRATSHPLHLNANPSIVAIGLEAADPDLLKRWCSEGELPNLSEMILGGSFRRLRSCTAISSGATWPSITTGVSPAKHGMAFYHRQLKPGTYRIIKKYADEVRSGFFWEPMSDAGRRIALFDVPVVHPLSDLNGLQIIGWGAEGLNWKQCSKPPHLLGEVVRLFGRHPLDGWYQKDIESVDEWRALRDKLIDGTRRRTRIAKWLYQQESWDLLLVGYPETHWAGHYFFHLLDEGHPRYDGATAHACGRAILEIYREIDVAIGQLSRECPDSTIFVFSNTGMGSNYSGQHLVPEILERLGLGGRRTTRGTNGGTVRNRRWGAYAIKTVESVVSARNIERLRKLIPEKAWDKYTRIFLNLGNGWRNSKAFAVPGDSAGAIRINLKGREPHGTVDPGEAYDRLCDELTSEFMALVNPATGRKAVSEIIKVQERFHGPCVDELPDLVVMWEGARPIESLTSPRIGTVSGTLPDKRSGAHRTYGFLIACGERIKRTGELEPADIVDIAPTILHLQGLPIPGQMDGRVLADMIDTP